MENSLNAAKYNSIFFFQHLYLVRSLIKKLPLLSMWI